MSSVTAKPLTTSDIEGPFYLAGAPFTTTLAPTGAPGEVLTLKGRVYVLNADGTTMSPLANALLDIWQADTNGVYDNQDWADPQSAPPGHVYLYRGKQYTNAEGEYEVDTIKPGHYKIGEENGVEVDRTSHIHVKVTRPGETVEILTTQLYFPNDKWNATDSWYSPLRQITDEEVALNGAVALDGEFDFVIMPSA